MSLENQNFGQQLELDVAVKELLVKWKLQELEELFIPHRIDYICLLKISDDDIDKIIPITKLNEKCNFKFHLEKWRQEQIKSRSTNETNTIGNITVDSLQIKSRSTNETNTIGNITIDSLDIHELLLSNDSGKKLIKYYNLYKSITTQQRRTLCGIIVNYLLLKYDNFKPVDFKIITEKIVNFFPSENKRTYYIPRETGTNPKGILYDKFTNTKKARKQLFPEQQISSLTTRSIDLDKNQYCQWLKLNNKPWETIKEYWNKTSKYRSPNHKLIKIWKLYSNTEKGYKLIDIDFEYHHPGKKYKLLDNWKGFLDTRALLLEEKAKLENPKISNLFNQYLTANENYKELILLMSLHHLIKPSKKYETHSNPITESKISIIYHHTKKFKNNHYKENNFLTPLIVVAGKKIENIHKYYVIYKTICYKFNCLSKALDIAFKIFHVFNLNYPNETKNVWKHIEKQLYDL